MQDFHKILETIDSYLVGSQWFVYALLMTGVFFTIYLKFPQIRFFIPAWKLLFNKKDKDAIGETSHFQALSTALSGTVGTGNIAGVALAIHLGGPSSMFWMLVTAFLGMTTKFVEVTLSHKYRELADNGMSAGGPMYYMKNRLNMKWLAVIFALAAMVSAIGQGNMPQINSIANSMNQTFGIDKGLVGIVLGIILALVIIGGIQRIVKFSEGIVPLMAIIYFVAAFIVMFSNIDNLWPAFKSIFTDIFSGTAATGGFLGATVAFAFNKGVGRGLFSNEAGQGSAPIAHASAKTKISIHEGFVAILEPFIDTIIICLLTGLVILSSGVWNKKFQNDFQLSDLQVITALSKAEVASQAAKEKLLLDHLNGSKTLPRYSGTLQVVDGKIDSPNIFLHSRSIAENITVTLKNKNFNGQLSVKEGRLSLPSEAKISGQSLLHSAPLTNKAFEKSALGSMGEIIVTISILLFAFSTAISWSYYGTTAMTFLWGTKYLKIYQFIYVFAFIVASFTDTSIIWTFSAIGIGLMAVPNLIGILLLHREMKKEVDAYKALHK